jgi:hypothetical protein
MLRPSRSSRRAHPRSVALRASLPLALPFALAACAGASAGGANAGVQVPGSPGSPSSLAGTYQGASNTTTNVTLPLVRHEVERDEHARVRIAQGPDGLTVTSLNTQPGEEPCTLHTHDTGDTLSILPNQACQGRRYGISITVTTTGGTVARSASGLTVEINMNVTGTYMNRPIAAVAQYHFEGAR